MSHRCPRRPFGKWLHDGVQLARDRDPRLLRCMIWRRQVARGEQRGRPPGNGRHGARWGTGRRPTAATTRWGRSWPRTTIRVPELVPSGTGGWPSPRGTTTGVRPPSWPPTSRSRPHSGIEVQLCGDAHVLNFGLWATPERNLVLRPARLRRDPAGTRSSGTSRAWPPAWWWRPGRRGPAGPGRCRGGRRRRGLRRPDAPVRRRCRSSTSGTTACTSTACSATSSRPTAGGCRSTSTRRQKRRTHRGAYARLTDDGPRAARASPRTRPCG